MKAGIEPSIFVQGWPTLNGRPLDPGDLPAVNSLSTQEWAAFARALRGQFAIIARAGDVALAATDLTGTFPVFVVDSPAGRRFAMGLDALAKQEDCTISAESLSKFCAFGTVGPACSMLAQAGALPGASIAIARGNEIQVGSWFDWPAAVAMNHAPLEDLEAEFRSIFKSWVNLHLSHGERVALLLSGGTDSALLAALLKPLLGDRLQCITQDFFSAAYSEKAAAIRTAEALNAPVVAAPIRRAEYYRAFRDTNGCLQDAAIHGVQAHNLYCLAGFARERGIDAVITGEHADSLFLGFGHFFHGFPQGLREYREAVSRASEKEKLDRLASFPPPASGLTRELLSAFEVSIADYEGYVKTYVTMRRRFFEPLLNNVPLPTLQQLGGQIDGGVGWREICLAVMRAYPGCRILCPFYDSDMIRFALRLPPEFIFRDGQTKYFLRQLLKKTTGLDCPKRPAALSPLRYWRVLPHARECAGMSPAVRPLYLKLLARNISKAGALYNDVAKIAGLGTWMASHRVTAH